MSSKKDQMVKEKVLLAAGKAGEEAGEDQLALKRINTIGTFTSHHAMQDPHTTAAEAEEQQHCF